MARLVYVQTETCDANPDGVAWYAYFDGRPTKKELLRAFEDESLVDTSCPLGWEDPTDRGAPEEVPNLLSEHAALSRWYVSGAC